MAIIDSIGYGGTVTEDDVAVWRRSFPGTYGVVGAGDWKVAVKPAVDRTLTIAPGRGWGHGVIDQSDNSTEDAVTLTTLASGTRWDLIVAHRDWSGAGGTTTFTKVTGTSSQTATFASRAQTPGTLDDQPLALVQVTGNGGGGVIDTVIDLRVWAANGGAVAATGGLGTNGIPLVLQYLNDAGTEVWVGNDVWHRYVDGAGALQWTRTATTSVPMYGVGSAMSGTPATTSDFRMQAGTQVATTDSAGFGRINFPVAFPTGLLTVQLTGGDNISNPDVIFATGWSNFPPADRTTVVYTVRTSAGVPRLNYLHRVNWLAVGW